MLRDEQEAWSFLLREEFEMSAEVNQKVKIVNDLLQAGEPRNVTKPDTNGYVGYEPQAIIDAMNEGFGIGNWGFEEISSETVDNEKGTLAVAQICVWLKDIEFRPFAWGQSRVTRGDTGDARKGAQTDAIKKALAYFSIGNRAYHGLLDGKKPAQTPQPKPKPALTTGCKEDTSAPAPASSGTIELDDMPPSSGQLENIRQLALHLGTRIQKPKTFKEAAQLLDTMQSEWDQMQSRGRAS